MAQSRMIPTLLARVRTELPPAPAAGPWPTEVLLFTQAPWREARELMDDARAAIIEGTAPGHRLALLEHPPTLLTAPDTNADVDALGLGVLRDAGCDVYQDTRRGPPVWIGPGRLAMHLTVRLGRFDAHGLDRPDVERFVEAVEQVLLHVLRQLGVEGATQPDGRAIRVDGRIVATIETQVRHARPAADGEPLWIAHCRAVLNTNAPAPPPAVMHLLDATAAEHASLAELGVPVERQDDIRQLLLDRYEHVFGTRLIIPQRSDAGSRKPPWLRARMPVAHGTERLHGIIGRKKLHTVCESAHCPNMGECWSHGTATFMINGNVCTRSCSFCAVFTGLPLPLDPEEPRRVAEAAAEMGIKYVVVTAVNRDERPDGGAPQFAATIRALREAIDGVRVEVLIPDFKGDAAALEAVFEARPDVLNHNMETVARLYRFVRPQANYARSLEVIRRARDAGLTTKSGIMLGLGEEEHEIDRTLRDLRENGCDIATIGQYLRPSEKHHPVLRYVTPAEFDRWREAGLRIGFAAVESGALVRSSYHAHESYARKRAESPA